MKTLVRFTLLVLLLAGAGCSSFDKAAYRKWYSQEPAGAHREQEFPGETESPLAPVSHARSSSHVSKKTTAKIAPAANTTIRVKPKTADTVRIADSAANEQPSQKQENRIIIHESPEKVSQHSAWLSLVLLLGVFIQSPVAFVFISLAIVFAAVAVIAGLHAKKKALAAGKPVPKEARTGIRIGLIVLSLITVSVVTTLACLQWFTGGTIPAGFLDL